MLGATSFLTFTHLLEADDGPGTRIAFAYKPPGSVLAGALEDLFADIVRGPLLPDALVLLQIEEDEVCVLSIELARDANRIAYQRLFQRVPTICALLSLRTGKVKATAIDAYSRKRGSAVMRFVKENVGTWLRSGLQSIFKPECVVLQAPPGYAYKKPSGSRERFFLKPELALATSASVAFVALALFHKLFAARAAKVRELQSLLVDTMAIAPVAYGLRDLLGMCNPRGACLIESFHSYGGIDQVRRPLRGTAVCLISASTSMAMHQKWIVDKQAGADEVITLLTVEPVTRFPDGALAAIARPTNTTSEGPPQLSIQLSGETFLPEQEPPKKVLLRGLIHGSSTDVSVFERCAGRGVFDVWRRPIGVISGRPRALFVDGAKLVALDDFKKWLTTQLICRARASTRWIVHQNDRSSQMLAEQVKSRCESTLKLGNLQLIAAKDLAGLARDEHAGVIVCAAVVGKGSQLLEISRTLRDLHEGPRLYLVGFQVTETRDELRLLPTNLRHAKGPQHDFEAYKSAAIGTQLKHSYQAEVSRYLQASASLRGLPANLQKRGRALGEVGLIGQHALLPAGQKTSTALEIRPGFAFWSNAAPAGAHQPEILATVGVLLQRAREEPTLPTEARLSSSTFRQVLLDPENFARFNDGVLQAALLRNAYPSEIDYRSDHAASDFMKSLILRTLARATTQPGEGILEMLLALALGRLQLVESHRQEVLGEAIAKRGRPAPLQRAIAFLLGAREADRPSKASMPF